MFNNILNMQVQTDMTSYFVLPVEVDLRIFSLRLVLVSSIVEGVSEGWWFCFHVRFYSHCSFVLGLSVV